MLAATIDRYGPPTVLQITEIPTPTPKPSQVRVRVVATTVTTADARIRGASFPPGFAPFARLAFGIRRPRKAVLGGSFSGVVDAIGSEVTSVALGDEVCGITGMAMGAHAEYVVVEHTNVTPKPSTVSHDDAAGAIFGGLTSQHFIVHRAAVGPDTTVLVNGASGALGTAAVQLAADAGATVTAVTSGRNADLVRDLGAAHVIDYTEQSIDTINATFDVVYDTVGNIDIVGGRRLLEPDGKLILAVASLGQLIRSRGNVISGSAPDRQADLAELLDRVATGRLRTVTDSSFRLDQIAEAHDRVDTGRKVGSVIVRP